MAENSWKKIAGTVGALTLAAVGSYFGIDQVTGSDTNSDSSAHSSSTANSTANSANSTTAQTQKPQHKAVPAGSDTCPLQTLPEEADVVIDRILTNQDHVYSREDGKHFGNYQNVLPKEKSSYYREYTVDTPGLNHRGARRIVVGGGTEDNPDVWYYTDDHYESFCKIPDAEG